MHEDAIKWCGDREKNYRQREAEENAEIARADANVNRLKANVELAKATAVADKIKSLKAIEVMSTQSTALESHASPCANCGGTCSVGYLCTACCSSELWLGKKPEIAWHDHIDKTLIRHQADAAVNRVKTLTGQVDLLLAHLSAVNERNVSIRKHISEQITEVEGGSVEQFRLIFETTIALAELREAQRQWHQIKSVDVPDEVRYAMDLEDSTICDRIALVAPLNDKLLSREVVMGVSKHLSQIEAMIGDPQKAETLCTQITERILEVVTEKDKANVGAFVIGVSDTVLSSADLELSSLTFPVQMLFRKEPFAATKGKLDEIAKLRRQLAAAMIRCEKTQELLMRGVAEIKTHAANDGIQAAKVLESFYVSRGEVARYQSAVANSLEELKKAEAALANNPNAPNLINERIVARNTLNNANESLAQERVGDGDLINDTTVMRSQTLAIFHARDELRELINQLSSCIAAHAERHQQLVKLDTQLNVVTVEVASVLDQLRSQLEYLEETHKAVKQSADRWARSIRRLVVKYGELLQAQGRHRELVQRLRLDENAASRRLESELAVAWSASENRSSIGNRLKPSVPKLRCFVMLPPPDLFSLSCSFSVPRSGGGGLDVPATG
ncbi:MAG: hypothetical protein R3C05_10635 [Pirellulaceae bacterium]